MEHNLYVPPTGFTRAVRYAERAQLAWHIIQSNLAIVAGKESTKEDAAGRAKYELQAPQELVDRAFAIADLYVAKCEERAEIVPYDVDAEAKAAGRFENIKSKMSFASLREEVA